MSYKALFNPMTSQVDYIKNIPISNTIHVAVNGGADFTKIQDAIDSVTTASIFNPYAILCHPGVYPENLTLKPFVYIVGVANGPGGPIITGKMTANFVNPGELTVLNRINQVRTVASDGEICNDFVGCVLINDAFLQISCSNNYAFTGLKMTQSSNEGALVSAQITVTSTFDGSTKDIIALHVLGSQDFTMGNSAIQLTAAASSGTLVGRKIDSTGALAFLPNNVRVTNTKAGFSGEICGSRVTTATASFRISQGEQIRLKGNGTTGTAIGMCLNTSGGAGEMFYVDTVLFESGFAPTTMYSANTALGDTQKVWLNSTNIDLPMTGLGLAIVTPHVLIQTGRVDWSQDPGVPNYWSYVPATQTLTVNKRGTGLVHSAPVVWAAGQSVAPASGIVDKAVNYIYVDSTGVLKTTVTPNETLYRENIVLFELWVQGTNYLMCREDHPAEFPTPVSTAFHNLFGPLLQDATQTLVRNDPAARTINISGTNTLTDHGINQAIAAQTPATWNQIVTGTGGSAYFVSAAQGIAAIYSNVANTTGTAIPNGSAGVWRLGVIKSGMVNDAGIANAQFIAYAHTASFATANLARNAITAGTIATFPSEMKKLEIAQLGYVVISVSAGGVATIAATTDVVTSLQVFSAAFVSGGTSTSSSLISTITTNFDRILSGADTNVQAALDTIDNNAMKIAYTTSFNATTDWGAAAGGYYTITILASTHLRGTSPIIRCRDLTSTPYEVVAPTVLIAVNGDVSIRVPDTDSGDFRFIIGVNIFG